MDANLLLFDVPSESIVQNKSDRVVINNPFDECEWIASNNREDDPFDIVLEKINKFECTNTNNILINMNGSCELGNNSNLNKSTDNSGSSSILLTPRSVKMAHKLGKTTGSPSPINSTRDRMHSDSGILKMTQGKNLLEKLRETTKSLDSDIIASVTRKTNEILCPSFSNNSNNTSCDDLNSTIPKWIESERDDDASDIETLTIPFLKENEQNEVCGSNGGSSIGKVTTQNGGDPGEQRHEHHHTKKEMNLILNEIKKSNANEEKQLFLKTLEDTVYEFIERFVITKNCDKIKNALTNLIDLLDGKDTPQPVEKETAGPSGKIIRQETFEMPDKKANPVAKVSVTVPPATKKPSGRMSLNVSTGRDNSINNPATQKSAAATTPKMKSRASISHQSLSNKKENRSPLKNVTRRSLYATPSKLVKPATDVSSARIRLRTKTQTLSSSTSAHGPLKATEPIVTAAPSINRQSLVPPKIVTTSDLHLNPPVISSTPIVPKRPSTPSRIGTPTATTPIGKGISKIATPRLSKLHTPSRRRSTLTELNAP